MTANLGELPRHVRRVLELAETDSQLRELVPDPDVEAAVRQPGLSVEHAIAMVLDGYAGRAALGAREYDIVIDPSTGRHLREYRPHFGTITFYELHNRIKGLANAWRHHEQHRVAPGDFVCTLGFTGTDYATVDMACAYAQAVSVPLQGTLAPSDLDGIFTDTAPTAVAATVDDLVLAAQLAGSHPSIRSVIAMDYDERADDDREAYAAAQTELAQTRSGAELITLEELIAFGDFQPWEFIPANDEGDDRIAALLHSSGSTGTPKGAIILQRRAKAQFDPSPLHSPVVRLVLAPMNHLAGRSMVHGTLARGGTAYFTTKSDLSMLFEDIRLVRPTELSLFPRILDMIHRHYQNEVLRRTEAEQGDAGAISAQVMEEMRTTFLGDRIAVMSFGSAPTTPEVKQFIDDCFQVTLLEGYGSTETGSVITTGQRVVRPGVIDYRLRDVPELGYYTSDKPFPRGELCVKTLLSTPGYFKRPEATAALFDDDGFLLTGDIMEERGPDHLVYVDRRNDVLKLSQGEFVATGALANVFENGSDVIHQIYLYGDSARSYLVAVVVPNLDVVEARLGADAGESEVKALIRSELKPSRCRATSSSSWSRSVRRTGCCRACTSDCVPPCSAGTANGWSSSTWSWNASRTRS